MSLPLPPIIAKEARALAKKRAKSVRVTHSRKGRSGPSLSLKKQRWADVYLETGDAIVASKMAYNLDKKGRGEEIAAIYANILAKRNMRDPAIEEYVLSVTSRATKTIVQLMDTSRDDRVRLGAAKDILDRLGFKAPETLEITDKRELTEEDREQILNVQRVLGMVAGGIQEPQPAILISEQSEGLISEQSEDLISEQSEDLIQNG